MYRDFAPNSGPFRVHEVGKQEKNADPKKSQEQEDLQASSSVAEQQRSTAAPQQQYLSKYLFNSGIAKTKDFMDVTFLHVQALSVMSRARTHAYT